MAGQGSIRAALSASLPTPAAALALMTFVLLYPPCAAASASIIKGLKSRKLAVLMVTGQSDPYGRYAGDLEAHLRAAGATVENTLLAAGHDIGTADLELAKAYKKRVIG